MPLDPRILMIFGVALVLAAAIWYRPRVGIWWGKPVCGDEQRTAARTSDAQRADGTNCADRTHVRDWIGWPIGLFGAAVAGYGLYLQAFA
jgi:hypothetical protein